MLTFPENPVFHHEPAARAAMEALRWPAGPTCPHCGEAGRGDEIMGTKHSHRNGLRHCRSCRKQFSVTIGTALERTRVSYVNWMRVAYLLSALDVEALSVPEVAESLSVTYKTAVQMLDRVANVLITYKGRLNKKIFGKPVTSYITGKARRPQPRLRFPQHPSISRDKASIGRRYRKWRERLKLDAAATPQPCGVLAKFDSVSSPENLDRVERLLILILHADPKEVSAAGKRRKKWPLHRRQLYAARVRSRHRFPIMIPRSLAA
jgi:transposase-like protein